MLHASRHTLAANIVQQVCAGILLLFLPNFLDKADYAQVVFVSVLLSFIGFADGGMSQAYGRVVPSLLAQERHDEVKLWDATTLRFGLIFSCFYSLIIAFIFYYRYENLTHTLLLLPMPFFVFWFSFHIARFSSAGNFRQYRIVNTWRALASLLALPLVWVMGLTGFFISNLFAAIIALLSVGKELAKTLNKPNWQLVKNHLPEGLILSLTGVLWMNLMYFSRFYASINYKPEDIATYGIINAASMSLISLFIAVFTPVVFEMRSLHAKSELCALEYADKIIRYSLPWTIAVMLLTIITAPILFEICFPKYHISNDLIIISFLGMTFLPLQNLFGNLMVIRKQFVSYFAFIILGILIAYASALIIDNYVPTKGAIYGQIFGIIVYVAMLFVKSSNFSSGDYKRLWKAQLNYLSIVYIFVVLCLLYCFIKYI